MENVENVTLKHLQELRNLFRIFRDELLRKIQVSNTRLNLMEENGAIPRRLEGRVHPISQDKYVSSATGGFRGVRWLQNRLAERSVNSTCGTRWKARCPGWTGLCIRIDDTARQQVRAIWCLGGTWWPR